MAELILKLKERELNRVPIVRVNTKIGRDAENDVVIDNAGVSRLHAVVSWDDGFRVLDQGSSNGIFVNGAGADSWQLSNGDEIQIGKFIIVFSTGGGVPPERLARENPLVEEPLPPSKARNPLATTHLSSADLQKFLAAKMAGGGDGRLATRPPVVSPVRTTGPPRVGASPVHPSRPTRPPRVASGQMKTRTAAESKAALFRNIAIVLGLMVLGLVGFTVYLLTQT